MISVSLKCLVAMSKVLFLEGLGNRLSLQPIFRFFLRHPVIREATRTQSLLY